MKCTLGQVRVFQTISVGVEMAIAIEGLTLIVRLDRAEALFPGGIEALEAAGNGSAGRDEYFWRCCFMADAEGEALFERWKDLGLNANGGSDPDMVLVSEFDLEVSPYCEWLQVHRSGKAVIAWLTGTTPKTVIATPGWSFENGSGLRRSSIDDQRLKFLREEKDGIEVYFDESLQQEVSSPAPRLPMRRSMPGFVPPPTAYANIGSIRACRP